VSWTKVQRIESGDKTATSQNGDKPIWYQRWNEETVICTKFGKDLFNICKVTGRKTEWPRFFGLPCRAKVGIDSL